MSTQQVQAKEAPQSLVLFSDQNVLLVFYGENFSKLGRKLCSQILLAKEPTLTFSEGATFKWTSSAISGGMLEGTAAL